MERNQPRFHRVNAPDRQHLEKLLNRIIGRIMRCLVRDGLLMSDQEQPWLDLQDTDTLDTLNAASTRYRVAMGPGAGGRTLTLQNPGVIQTILAHLKQSAPPGAASKKNQFQTAQKYLFSTL